MYPNYNNIKYCCTFICSFISLSILLRINSVKSLPALRTCTALDHFELQVKGGRLGDSLHKPDASFCTVHCCFPDGALILNLFAVLNKSRLESVGQCSRSVNGCGVSLPG